MIASRNNQRTPTSSLPHVFDASLIEIVQELKRMTDGPELRHQLVWIVKATSVRKRRTGMTSVNRNERAVSMRRKAKQVSQTEAFARMICPQFPGG
jgi:hypothetical protein